MNEIKMSQNVFVAFLCVCFVLGFLSSIWLAPTRETLIPAIANIVSKPKREYNQEKDSIVNAVIKNNNHQYKNWNSDNHYYTGFMTNTHMLVVAHYHQKEYLEEEQWYFMLTEKSGKDIYINDIDSKNKISPKTLAYLKSLCK